MHVPIPIPMATVPIFATDIDAINQLQLHFSCFFAIFTLCKCRLHLSKNAGEVVFITENKHVDNKEYTE